MSRRWLTISVAGTTALAALASAGAQAAPNAFPGRNGTILAAGGEFEGRSNVVGVKLYAVSVQSRRPQQIRGVRTALGGGQAAWSPDGKRIAFARLHGGISVADAAGRHRARITTQGQKPAWSPDGSEIIFTQAGWLYVVRADGGGLRRLFRGWNAQWSPDGKRIVFQLSEREDGLNELYVSAVDGSSRVQLTVAAAFGCGGGAASSQAVDPAWAPDGTRIAYVASEGCGRYLSTSIVAVAPDGSGRGLVVDSGYFDGGPFAPVWSPDGKAIAYFEEYDYESAPNGLKVLPLGGRARTVAASLIPLDWRPVCGLQGASKGDRLRGSDRGDVICGLAGNDTIAGGAGSDRLFGEDGNDRFFARDGEFDVVGCGAGRDTVIADSLDLVGRDCERVTRG